MEIDEYLSQIREKFQRDETTENSYRSILEQFIESLGEGITALNEPRRIECGAPDFNVSREDQKGVPLTIGYLEAKDIGKPLSKIEESEQLKRYRERINNLILTNHLEFRWFVNGELRQKPVQIAHIESGQIVKNRDREQELLDLLTNWISHEPEPIDTPSKLAKHMANLTHMIREIVIDSFKEDLASESLRGIRQAFAEILLPEVSKPENIDKFADVYAQTISYGIFTARVNHDGSPEEFRGLDAAPEIPKTNPLLRQIFDHLTSVSFADEPYVGFLEDLSQLLANANMESILKYFGEIGQSGEGEDPVVHFYETFLQEYDPEMKKRWAIFLTPSEVVSYIVNSVDKVLKKDLECADGIADTSEVTYKKSSEEEEITETSPKVLMLDPACGTGTFLYSIVKKIREQFMEDENAGMWSEYVNQHLLPRLFGFEILMAPYAVAHFKLSMELLGQDLEPSIRDTWRCNLDEGERIKIFLTDTLERPDREIQQTMGPPYQTISEEAQAAKNIKKEKPILIVLGNPPYSNFAPTENSNSWIDSLVGDWKPSWVDKWNEDDYMKFLRWGQWRIDQTGEGVLAFITNNTYLDSIILTEMRESLMETFTKIYVVNLHGGIYEPEPEGVEDNENVFDEISEGVAISFFVKEDDGSGEDEMADVYIRNEELWGTREQKRSWLKNNTISSTNWKKLEPQKPSYNFIEESGLLEEFSEGWSIEEIFHLEKSGVQTDKDKLFTDFDKSNLQRRMRKFLEEDELDSDLKSKYNIRNTTSYPLLDRRQEHSYDSRNIRKYLYRPFDERWVYYQIGFTSRPAKKVMHQLINKDNFALLGMKQYFYDVPQYNYAFVTNGLVNRRVFTSKRGAAYVFPLYLYLDQEEFDKLNQLLPKDALYFYLDQKSESDLLKVSGPIDSQDNKKRIPNLDPNFIEEIEEKLGLKFSMEDQGNLQDTFGPENLFYYIYGILHSKKYRERYESILRRQYPHIPFTSDVNLFHRISKQGKKLVNYHLLESEDLSTTDISYPVTGNDKIRSIEYKLTDNSNLENSDNNGTESLGRIYINQNQYFKGVPLRVWEFGIGGYKVCNRWLKDRKGEKLSYDEKSYYKQVITSLKLTIDEMREIDSILGSAGGFPLK